MARWIDRLLALLKWPIAACALLVLPGAAIALVHSARGLRTLLPFVLGFAAYALLWLFFLRKPAWGSLLSTLEHELTHALFALLTLHAVTGMSTSWRRGGHTTFSGGTGNWLISLAPYFFPTLSAAAVISLRFVPAEHRPIATAILGATVAYHVASTWVETHRRQTDLSDAGWIFSLAFLPAANLLAYGLLFATIQGRAQLHLHQVAAVTEELLRRAL